MSDKKELSIEERAKESYVMPHELIHYKNQLAAQSKLLEQMATAYATYLEFLEKHYADKAVFAMIHGQRDSEEAVKKGQELRDVIAKVLKAYETLGGQSKKEPNNFRMDTENGCQVNACNWPHCKCKFPPSAL